MGKSVLDGGGGKRKGFEVGVFLVCFRKNEEVIVFGVEWGNGSFLGDEFKGRLGFGGYCRLFLIFGFYFKGSGELGEDFE